MTARGQASERDAPYEDSDLAMSHPLGRAGGFGIFMPMSDQLAQAHAHYNALRGDMSQWIAQSIRRDGPDQNHGGEDEANYALAFFSHYLISGDERIAARFRTLVADLKAWVEAECLHGYEPEAEAHHGTEPFLLFLPRYLGFFPDDQAAAALLTDAAHHIGNWVAGFPEWYDWERDVFHSYWIGTRLVGGENGDRELAEHFRFLHIALAAWRVTGEERYRDWALRYGRKRAERLLQGEGPTPVLWDLDGRGLHADALQTAEERRMAAANHHLPGDPLAGIENFLASGVIYALGDLFQLQGDEIFQAAARKIVEPLAGELLDPYADPAAAALSYYRRVFDDTSLDGAMRGVLAQAPPAPDAPWAMVFPQERIRREPGVGKRNDMIYWGQWAEDGSVQPSQEPSTAALTLHYQLTGEVVWARRALQAAAAKFAMARRVLRGGREHADMGGAICSVAAGHGRNWGCGAVTGCYGPLLMGMALELGAEVALVEWQGGALPADVLALVRPPVGGQGELLLYNGGEASLELSWRQRGAAAWKKTRLQPGQTSMHALEESG